MEMRLHLVLQVHQVHARHKEEIVQQLVGDDVMCNILWYVLSKHKSQTRLISVCKNPALLFLPMPNILALKII